MTAPSGWYPDPTSRFELRYWSGAEWTEHVAAGGAQGTDALTPEPPEPDFIDDDSATDAEDGGYDDLDGFSWGGLTAVITHEGATGVSSWDDFDEALEIYAHRDEGLIGITWSSGIRHVRCFLLDGHYAVDVKKWRDGVIYDVWTPEGRPAAFEDRRIDEDIIAGWTPDTVCATVSPARAFAIARQWMESETVPAGYTLRAMANTTPLIELDLDFEAATARVRDEHEARERSERARALGLTSRGPRPEPLPYGVSDAGAEVLVRDWMRFLGAIDAETTRASKDGGIDVVSAQYVAQVKNYRGSVGAPEVRELYGAAQHDGREPLYFTSGTFTAEAIRFADAVKMGLLRYDAVEASLQAANERGSEILRVGL